MAKKGIKKKDNKEVIANCDQLLEVDANCDPPDKGDIVLSQHDIEKLIVTVRGYVSDLVRSAKQRIVLIDNFVDDRVLTMLDKRAEGVSATIHSRYYEQFQVDLKERRVLDWDESKGYVHMWGKVIDSGTYTLFDADKKPLWQIEGYVVGENLQISNY